MSSKWNKSIFFIHEEEVKIGAKVRAEILGETVTSRREVEDMAGITNVVTIIIVMSQGGIIVLSTQIKSVVCMVDTSGAIVFIIQGGKIIQELLFEGLLLLQELLEVQGMAMVVPPRKVILWVILLTVHLTVVRR